MPHPIRSFRSAAHHRCTLRTRRFARLRISRSAARGSASFSPTASLALRDKGSAIKPASKRALTFGGLAATSIPAGAILVSDPVDLAVPDRADLAVDLYIPDDTATWKSPVTVHPASWQVNYVSNAGNHVGEANFPVAATTAYRRGDGLASASSFFLGRIEVSANAPVWVAFGDSITDAIAS
jgi:hypothetical protein